MALLKQHIPDFCSGFEPQSAVVQSAEEFPSIDWIRTWSEDPGFHQFSVARDKPKSLLLMCEYDDGRKWWVVGYLSEDLPELPAWKPGS